MTLIVNAISYRFTAFAEYDDLFTTSISKHGTAPPAEERYRQERNLFGFFSNGFSTFESFFYAAFAAAALIQPTRFPIGTPQQQRNITAGSTVAEYRRTFTNASVVQALEDLTKDPSYLQLKEIRNILSHRSAPGRTIHVAFGDEPAPDQWKLANIVLDKNTTSTRRGRAVQVLASAMDEFCRFTETNF